MTMDAAAILLSIFSTIWRLFTSWYIPGTHTTPAAFFLFLGFAGIILRFVARSTMTYNPHQDKPLDESTSLTIYQGPGQIMRR